MASTSEVAGIVVKESDMEVKGSTIKSSNERVSSRSYIECSSNDNNTKRSNMRVVPPSPNEVNCNKKGRSGLTKSLLE